MKQKDNDHSNDEEYEFKEVEKILKQITTPKNTYRNKLKHLGIKIVISILSIFLTIIVMTQYLTSSTINNIVFFITYGLIDSLFIFFVTIFIKSKIRRIYARMIILGLSIIFTLAFSNLYLYIHFQSKLSIIAFFIVYYLFMSCLNHYEMKKRFN